MRNEKCEKEVENEKLFLISHFTFLISLSCTLNNVPRVNHCRGAAFAGFEPDHDVLGEIRFAAERRLCNGNRPVLHVGERLVEVAEVPVFRRVGCRDIIVEEPLVRQAA